MQKLATMLLRSTGDTLGLFPKIWRRVKTDGAGPTLRFIGARSRSVARSLMEDRRRGISTARVVKDDELGIEDEHCHWYVATDYKTFHDAMRHVDIRAGHDVFVDFGSGKGRIVMLAADYPFRRVFGVEFSPQLHKIAEENLRNARAELRCQDVRLILADATQWTVPPDATVFFFFNPFDGAVLAQVCENIRCSLIAAPRKLTLIYVRPEKFFEKEIAWQTWLTRTGELRCLEGKVSIYESKPVTAG